MQKSKLQFEVKNLFNASIVTFEFYLAILQFDF